MRRVFLICCLALIKTSFLSADCLEDYEAVSQPAHDGITRDLFEGEVISGGHFSADNNGQEVFKVKVYNNRTSVFRDAIFKPRRPGDGGGFARAPMEYVAYWINRKLGMDYVPPTAYRKQVTINGETMEGALIFFVPPENQHDVHRKLPDLKDQLSNTQFKQELGLSKEAVFSDSRILNVLLQNRDGHVNNLLVGKHWVFGLIRPVFIDFGASRHPSPGGRIAMDDYWVYRNSDSVQHIRGQTFERLKRLNDRDLQGIAEFMNEGERKHTLQIRDGIVGYFTELISSNGRENVVIEE